MTHAHLTVAEIEKLLEWPRDVIRDAKGIDKGSLAYACYQAAEKAVTALKQRRLVTRERLAEWRFLRSGYRNSKAEPMTWAEAKADGVAEEHLEWADALLSADLGFKVVSEEEIAVILEKQFRHDVGGHDEGSLSTCITAARAILRLFDGRREAGAAQMTDRMKALEALFDWAIDIAFNAQDVGGGELQEKALELGLLETEPYDPDEHGSKPAHDWGLSKGDLMYRKEQPK